MGQTAAHAAPSGCRASVDMQCGAVFGGDCFNLDVPDYLLAGEEVFVEDAEFISPLVDERGKWKANALSHRLHWACGKGITACIQRALDNGAEIEARRSAKGGRVCTTATIRKGTTTIAVLHVQNMSTSPGVSWGIGFTPLMRAAKGGHSEAVELLVSLGAKTAATDERGCTALHLAASSGSRETCLVLLRAGASRRALDCEGCDPMDYVPARCLETKERAKAWNAVLRPAGRWVQESDDLDGSVEDEGESEMESQKLSARIFAVRTN